MLRDLLNSFLFFRCLGTTCRGCFPESHPKQRRLISRAKDSGYLSTNVVVSLRSPDKLMMLCFRTPFSFSFHLFCPFAMDFKFGPCFHQEPSLIDGADLRPCWCPPLSFLNCSLYDLAGSTTRIF